MNAFAAGTIADGTSVGASEAPSHSPTGDNTDCGPVDGAGGGALDPAGSGGSVYGDDGGAGAPAVPLSPDARVYTAGVGAAVEQADQPSSSFGGGRAAVVKCEDVLESGYGMASGISASCRPTEHDQLDIGGRPPLPPPQPTHADLVASAMRALASGPHHREHGGQVSPSPPPRAPSAGRLPPLASFGRSHGDRAPLGDGRAERCPRECGGVDEHVPRAPTPRPVDEAGVRASTPLSVDEAGVRDRRGTPHTACDTCRNSPVWTGPAPEFALPAGQSRTSMSKRSQKRSQSWSSGIPPVKSACRCCAMRFWSRRGLALHDAACRAAREAARVNERGRAPNGGSAGGASHGRVVRPAHRRLSTMRDDSHRYGGTRGGSPGGPAM